MVKFKVSTAFNPFFLGHTLTRFFSELLMHKSHLKVNMFISEKFTHKALRNKLYEKVCNVYKALGQEKKKKPD